MNNPFNDIQEMIDPATECYVELQKYSESPVTVMTDFNQVSTPCKGQPALQHLVTIHVDRTSSQFQRPVRGCLLWKPRLR